MYHPGWLSFLLVTLSRASILSFFSGHLAGRGSSHFQTVFQVLGWQLLLCVTNILGHVLHGMSTLCIDEEFKARLVREDATGSSQWGFPGCPLSWPQAEDRCLPSRSAVSCGSITTALSRDPHSDPNVESQAHSTTPILQ